MQLIMARSVSGSWHAWIVFSAMLMAAMFGQQPTTNAGAELSCSNEVQFATFQRPVMTWVPAYARAKSLERLNEQYGSAGMSNALTHLALQFWEPTTNGAVRIRAKYSPISDEDIFIFRDWAHARGIRVMLCVFNGMDWPLARMAFADHGSEFAAALASEVSRLGLDGIDLDLEGEGKFDTDKPAFVEFVSELGERLRAQGQQLTVATFANIWHAPNQTWWADLFPHVDGLSSMGYESIGADAEGWRSYAAQKAAAGVHAHNFMLGLPSFRGVWQNRPLNEHLSWIQKDKTVGVAIWDAQLRDPAWREEEIWKVLGEIRGSGSDVTTPTNSSGLPQDAIFDSPSQ